VPADAGKHPKVRMNSACSEDMIMTALMRFLLVALAVLPSPASAQAFPSKPVRIVVGFAAGGAADTVARSTVPRLSELLGQPVVIDNRAGAAGMIGSETVARSPADGHTLLMGASNHYLAPFFRKEVTYDALKDFVPVALLSIGFNLLAVTPSLPVNSVQDLIDLARKNPGKLSYATVGIGSLHHLNGTLFAQAAAIDIVHVAYKGGSQAINDLIGGTIPMAILNAATVMPQVRSGKLRAIALFDSQRARSFPDLPIIKETLSAYAAPGSWFGILAPAGLPSAIVRRLNSDFRKVTADAEVQKRIEGLGFDIALASPEEFATKVNLEYEAIRKAVTAAGIKPE
jgi:tripartite-type tricarboxylate transporter receptor subunit TctC